MLYDWRMRLLVRILLNGLAILAAAWIVPGVALSGPVAAIVAGAILGIVNTLIRPILLVLTLPFTLVTLGLFIFVVNAICFAVTAALVPGFSVRGFGAALFGALVVSIVSWVMNGLLADNRRD